MPDNATEASASNWEAIGSKWKPVSTGVGYSLGLVMILIAVIVLPLLYVGLLGGIAYATYWYLGEFAPSTEHLRAGAQFRLGLLYLLPAVAGLVLIIIMLKPFVAPRARHGKPIVLERYEEPELHEFVENVCRAIGAPTPKVIHLDCDVNASAGFRSGVLSLFMRRDLVLTIGMPLVAALSKRQFAGVLAHEFGHFAQGAGMRTTYLAGNVINWYMRVAFERDSIDLWIAGMRGSHSIGAVLFALLFQLLLGITRLVVRALAYIGMMLCSFMLRRMEFDADRYEIQLAGSGDFGATFQKLAELSEAGPIAMEECRRTYFKDRTVPNNFAALLADYSKRLPPETRDAIAQRIEKESLGMFSTHPSTKARIAAAEQLNEPGLYTDESSARQLFGDFTAACVKATYGHWKGMLGSALQSATLVDTMPMLKMTGQGESKQDAVSIYLGFEPPTWRPFFPGMLKVSASEHLKPLVERLKKSRARIRELSEAAKPQAGTFRSESELRIKWEMARAIMDAGLTVNFKSLGLKPTSRLGVSTAIDKHNTAAIAAAGSVDELAEVATHRVRAAINILGVKGIETVIDDADERRARADNLLAALSAMREVLPMVTKVRELVGVIGVAATTVKDQKTFEKAKAVVRPLSDQMRDNLDAARRIAGGVADPLDEGEYATNLGETLVGATPAWRDIDEIVAVGQTFVDRYADVYRRTLAELIYVAQRVEQSLVRAAKQQPA